MGRWRFQLSSASIARSTRRRTAADPGAVSTVLVSRAVEIARAADPAARGPVAANAFRAAAWVMFVVAAPGALTAAIAGGPDNWFFSSVGP